MKRLGAYELRGELARGAMGVVFRAHDPALDRPLAIKVIRSEDVRDPESQERFLLELRILARLRHPHVIAVHSAGMSEHGYPYVAMDLIEGGSLKQRLADRGPLPIDDAVRIAIQLAEALDYAHTQGVLHRDVKPHNVLMDGDDAVLTDFGLAKILGAGPKGLTQSGDQIGTPAYMAPEQVLGHNDRVGPTTDVYALGVTLFEMLTKQRPHSGASVIDVFNRIASQPPSSVSEFRGDVDPELAAIVARCLEKEPRDRYLSAKDLRDALVAWQTPIQAPHSGVDSSTLTPLRRSRLRTAATALGLIAIGLIVGLLSEDTVERSLRRNVHRSELPEALEILSSRGFERGSRDDLVGALEDYDAVLSAEPNCAIVLYRRARLRQTKGLKAEALQDIERVLELDPEFAEGYSSRAQLRQPEDPAGALADCDRALALEPLNPTFFHNRAALHFEQKRDAEARQDIERSLELDPRFAKAYQLRGFLKARAGDVAGALADFGQGLAFEPTDAKLVNQRGLLRYKQGDLAGAVADFTAAISAKSETPVYHRNRARVRQDQGKLELALADLNIALEIDPNGLESLDQRALLYLRLRRWLDAVADMERSAELLEQGHERRAGLLNTSEKLRAAVKRSRYKILSKPVEMRIGPGKQFGVLADVGPGSEVLGLGEEDGWLKIQATAQGGASVQGYVPAESASLMIEGGRSE